MSNKPYTTIALVSILLATIIITSGFGALSINPAEWLSVMLSRIGIEGPAEFNDAQASVLLHIRSPRVVMSAAMGILLAISGAAIQGLFRNPMADPSIIGVSAGATLFAAITIVFLGSIDLGGVTIGAISTLSIMSFAGAALSIFLIYKIASIKTKVNVAAMLLAGIAFNALAMAVTGLMSYITSESQLRTLMFWTMGSIGGAHWLTTAITVVIAIVSVILLLPMGKHLNAISLGESEALFLGTPVEKVKKTIIIATSLAIGISVAFCGIIGFVGLVIPHILRTLGVSDYRKLLLYSALMGSILLCWADSLARTVVNPAELPIGIITALIGAPIFMFLLTKFKTRLN